MEASVAQPGQAAPEAAGENGGAPEAPGVDLAPVLEQFGELKGVVDEMRTEMAQFRQPAEQPQQEEPEPEIGDWFGVENPEWNPEHAQHQLQEHIRRAAEAATQPLRQEVLNLRRQTEAARLIEEFPELAEQERAKEAIGQSEALAGQLAQSLGLSDPRFAEALGTEPGFVRLVHMAAVAAKAAAEEQQPGSEEAHLEGGGGASPPPPEEDLGDRIVRAGGRQVLPW